MHNTIRSFNDSSSNDWTKEDKKPKMLTKQRDKYDCPRRMLESAEQEYYSSSDYYDMISEQEHNDILADAVWEEYLSEQGITA